MNFDNINKQEEFINHLENSVNEDILKLDKLNEDLLKLENLKYFINNLIEKNLKELKIDFDVGCSIYYSAHMYYLFFYFIEKQKIKL